MKTTSSQTKSFVILLAVALVGTYAVLLLANKLQGKQAAKDPLAQTPKDVSQIVYAPKVASAVAAPDPVVDTGDWKTYTDEKLGLSFKYKPDWQIKPAVKSGDYYVTEIDPGKKFYNIKIYTSNTGYYAMDSLPIKQVTIGGKTADDVSDMLYGVQNGAHYYTFDLGLSVSLKPYFNALVHSVNFLQ